jgi:hypothetical protein
MSSLILSGQALVNSFVYNIIGDLQMSKPPFRILANGRLPRIIAVAGRLFCYSSD